MDNLKLYCVTDKEVLFLQKTDFKINWVGETVPSKDYIFCDKKDNIIYKKKYYSELTFHYRHWKSCRI